MLNLIINPKDRFYRVEGHIISRSLLSVVVVCFKCLLPKLRAGMRFYDDGYGSETHLREVPIYVKSRIVTS